ncbi:MAG: SCO family protein [SAR202 cluster bacterium]|nr:SCO family protein [SAR202 cluster bacterium]
MTRFRTADGSERLRLVKLMPFVVFLLATAALLTACGSKPTEAFTGTEFTTVEPAFDFELQDQFGDLVSLTDHENKVVVLTFLYTNCPDVCPIITTQLRETFLELADVRDDVEFVAVSVDPERDSVSEAREFLDKWGLVNDWSYLVGAESQLQPIWKAYFVDPAINEQDTLQTNNTPSPQASGALGSLSQQITNTYLIIHSSPVFLIDREGQRRVVFTSPLDPSDIAHDIRMLLDD